MKKLLMLSVAAFALAAPAAFAEDAKTPPADAPAPAPVAAPEHHKGDLLEKLDTNGDGVVTKEEFMSFHEKRFVEIDTNGDGKITKEEGEAKRAEWKAKMKEQREMHMKEKSPSAAPAETPAK